MTTTDSIRTKMKSMSTIVRSNNSNNFSSLSSPAHIDFPSRAEEIVVCSPLLFEALFIVTGNLVTNVFFALEKELRKRKSLFLVINMAFADVMLGAVSRFLCCLLKSRFSAMEFGLLLPSLRYRFLAGSVNLRSFYVL